MPYFTYLKLTDYCGSTKDHIGRILENVRMFKMNPVPEWVLVENFRKTKAVHICSNDPVAEKDVRNQDVSINSIANSDVKSRSRRTRGSRAKNEINDQGRMKPVNFCKLQIFQETLL